MWKTVKLDELCTIKGRIGYRGYTKADLVEKGNGAITLSPSNIISNKLSFNKNRYISWEKYYESPEIMLEIGDIVFCKTASIGKLALVEKLPEKTTLNPQFVVLKNITCNAKFLHYYMQSTFFNKQLSKIVGGAAIPTVSQKNLGNLIIFIPPLPEQERIVTKLDAAFAEIDEAVELTALKKEQINKFKCSILNINNKKNDFFKSALNDLEELKIGEICDLMTGATPSRKVPEYFDNGQIKWLVSGDINQKEIFDCDGRITEEGLNNSSAKFLPENSVLIALNGQGKTRGTVAMLKTKATCNQSLVSIFPKSGVNLNTKYLYYFLEGMYDKIRRITGDSGNDRRGLNMPLIRDIKILLPPITEQENIISKLEMAINELDIANRVLDEVSKNYKALKSAILYKNFNQVRQHERS